MKPRANGPFWSDFRDCEEKRGKAKTNDTSEKSEYSAKKTENAQKTGKTKKANKIKKNASENLKVLLEIRCHKRSGSKTEAADATDSEIDPPVSFRVYA